VASTSVYAIQPVFLQPPRPTIVVKLNGARGRHDRPSPPVRRLSSAPTPAQHRPPRPPAHRRATRPVVPRYRACRTRVPGVHMLRHSAAVAWLEAGVHIKAVANLLGHSSIAITGDVYGHTSDDTARAAVDRLATQLGLSARPQRRSDL
jgi:integrase